MKYVIYCRVSTNKQGKTGSGDGAAAGTGNGTSSSVASQDNSIANMSNAP